MHGETVSDVGEFGLIDRLIAALPDEVRQSQDAVSVGVGDDAAVVSIPPGEHQIITTDALVEGVHFRLDWTDWESLGHKALAVNLSDIAAMGGIPTIAVVTLGLRGNELVTDLEAMYRGMGALARRHGVVIVGGDIVRVAESRLVSVTAIGATGSAGPLLRTGARPGDVIGVTGTIGASAAGLEVLRTPKRFTPATTAQLLVVAHVRPEPRIQAGQMLAKSGATAAMDLSDGLAGDLPKIMVASDVSAEIQIDRLPVIAAVRALFPDRWDDLALRGGEDYELLFTIPEQSWPDLITDAQAAGITLTRVGTIIARDGEPAMTVQRPDGTRETITAGAFDHFGDPDQLAPEES